MPEGWRGGALSLLLHGLLLAAAIAYLAHRPVLSPPQFHSIPVEIVPLMQVLGQATRPGPSTSEASAHAARARRQPAAAPQKEGTSPRGTRQPEDELSARLRALAQLRQDDDATVPGNASVGGGSGTGAGAYTLKDFVRAQILRRWLPNLSVRGGRDMPVTLRLRLLASGTIDQVTIVDAARMKTDEVFHDMALAARDAALLASPLRLPPGNYPRVQTLTIELQPSAVLH